MDFECIPSWEKDKKYLQWIDFRIVHLEQMKTRIYPFGCVLFGNQVALCLSICGASLNSMLQ